MVRHPCVLGGPKTEGEEIRIGSLTPAFSLAEKRGRKYYVTPAFSGVPKPKGTKSELVASSLPSHGPKMGQKCYVTPAF